MVEKEERDKSTYNVNHQPKRVLPGRQLGGHVEGIELALGEAAKAKIAEKIRVNSSVRDFELEGGQIYAEVVVMEPDAPYGKTHGDSGQYDDGDANGQTDDPVSLGRSLAYER